MNNTTIEAEVIAIRQQTARVREYLLAPAPGQRFLRYDAGSHIEVHLNAPVLGNCVRHYSLIGGDGAEPDGVHRYRIAVQREGRGLGSDHIHDSFEVGTRVRISTPRNHFLLGRNDARSLLLAGGIGITPIYAMLRSLVRRRKDFAFVYSGRTEETLAYRNETLALAAEHGTLHLSGPDGEQHLDLQALLAAQPDGTTVYVCGPAGMVAATERAAQALGWRPDRVRSEHFGAANSAADVGFEVHLARSGQRIPVGRNTSVLDALSAAGLDLLSDCRRGECGLCPLPVVSSDGPIDHRDRYLSDEERGAGNTMCVCVSRIRGKTLTLDL